jgi:hypothetical protein
VAVALSDAVGAALGDELTVPDALALPVPDTDGEDEEDCVAGAPVCVAASDCVPLLLPEARAEAEAQPLADEVGAAIVRVALAVGVPIVLTDADEETDAQPLADGVCRRLALGRLESDGVSVAFGVCEPVPDGVG